MTYYGPTGKQLGKLGELLRYTVQETLDVAGWYEDGARDASKGRRCDFGDCQLQENQDAYKAGYRSVTL